MPGPSRGSDGANMRAFENPVEFENLQAIPEDCMCTHVWVKGKPVIKFRSDLCRHHGGTS